MISQCMYIVSAGMFGFCLVLWTLCILFYNIMLFVLFYFLKILFIFIEWEREGEREGEKHQCVVVSYVSPPRGTWLATQARALVTLWFTGRHSIH